MISIANPRAEKAARRLAKAMGSTIADAVAIACEKEIRTLDAQAEGRRRREEFEAIRAEIHAKYRMPKTAKARAAKSGHDFLYGEDGLPK
jgi:hypothetical protein